MGRMFYLKPEEEQIITSYGKLCNHLNDYWQHFCDQADFWQNMLKNNYSEEEKDHFDFIAIEFRRKDRKLRPLVKDLGLEYKDIINYYVAAVYNSKYESKGEKLKC